MTRPIAISLSPNTEADDISLAGNLLLRPNTWYDAAPREQAHRELLNYFPEHQAVLLSSGRAALYYLLQALNIGSGSEVIIQAFTCSVVPAAVQWAGARPIYADIETKTFNFDLTDLAKKITPRTRAIIIQHTFGLPAPVDEIKQLVAGKNIKIIEDCAHSLGARYKEQPVGRLTDAAFLSFGRDKTISCVFGGAVVSRDATLIEKITVAQRALPEPPRTWIAQQLFHPVAFAGILPVYFSGRLGQIKLRALQKLHLLSKAVTPAEKIGRQPRHLHYQFPGALAELLTLQLKKLPRYTQHRQTIAHRYEEALSNHPGITLPEPTKDSSPNWLRYPLFVSNPHSLQQQAKQHRMVLGDWYDTVIAPKDCDPKQFGYAPGSCPVAEDATRKVINLPTYPTLTSAQVDEVINLVKRYA